MFDGSLHFNNYDKGTWNEILCDTQLTHDKHRFC